MNIIPLMGLVPISHMGHYIDIGKTMTALPTQSIVGISNNCDVFSPEERIDIIKQQWGNSDVDFVISSNAIDTFNYAYDKYGVDLLTNIVVGRDRLDFAERLMRGIRDKSIKTMTQFPHYVGLSVLGNRKHNLSGTNMRKAAAKLDYEAFSSHLGKMFSSQYTTDVMFKIHNAIECSKIKIKR